MTFTQFCFLIFISVTLHLMVQQQEICVCENRLQWWSLSAAVSAGGFQLWRFILSCVFMSVTPAGLDLCLHVVFVRHKKERPQFVSQLLIFTLHQNQSFKMLLFLLSHPQHTHKGVLHTNKGILVFGNKRWVFKVADWNMQSSQHKPPSHTCTCCSSKTL